MASRPEHQDPQIPYFLAKSFPSTGEERFHRTPLDISNGQRVIIDYEQGRPIVISLANGRHLLEIGSAKDLGINHRLGEIFLFDRYSHALDPRKGFEELIDRQRIILGRKYPHSFEFDQAISPYHLAIERAAREIVIEDLHSKTGTVVFVLQKI